MEWITGTSSGLGYGLAQHALELGIPVAGISRRPSPLSEQFPQTYFHETLDLQTLPELPPRLRQYFQNLRQWVEEQGTTGQAASADSREMAPGESGSPGVQRAQSGKIMLKRVWLNAGLLGRIDDLQNTTLSELKELMDVNLWANKIIIDSLNSPDCPFQVDHIIAISSGASVNGNRGWSGYSISKAALNMLIKLYSEELPEVHFISLAPGLIDTAMQETISVIEDTDRFTALKRLQQARGTDAMPPPLEAAARIMEKWPVISDAPSGSFLDVRKL